MKQKAEVSGKVLFVLFFLYMFLLSIALMGAAFKGFGKDFAENLIATTSNPFVGLFIGILATSLIQSSSTTTSIVVGIVGAGGLGIPNAIPIIMGANIGTTVTNTLVSLGHVSKRGEFRRAIAGATVHDFFNLICVCIMFPLELLTGFLSKSAIKMTEIFQGVGGFKATSPIKMITKPVVGHIKHALMTIFGDSDTAGYVAMLIFSAVILFFALYFIVKLMRSLIIGRAEIILNNIISKHAVLSIFLGVVFTTFVQSSSITTSLLIPLVASGILTVEAIFPITLGANVGTTTTAILASFATANPTAITIAFAHFLFNFCGTIFIYPVPLFRRIPIRLARGLGHMAARKRWYAFVYVITLFFIIPGILIGLSRLFT